MLNASSIFSQLVMTMA